MFYNNIMNRIRKINNTYQVLITPTQLYNAGWEIMRASFYMNDQYLRNYTILNFKTLGDAQCEAFKHPDLDWDSIVLLHENSFIDIRKILENHLASLNYIVDFRPRITNALELKNTIFDRVLNSGNRFNLSYQMNDVISFDIINPWTQNLDELAFHLSSDKRLRIVKKVKTFGVITLIGMTELTTTYEIVLWPTILYQWAKWIKMHNITDNKMKTELLKKSLITQKQIDSSQILR